MRLKKGFTLAEILIVLMVIGVIATMTIPSMMKGVTEAQLKTGYKKAFNTISNFAAMEKVAGTLPNRASQGNINALYTALNNSLSVKAYGTDAGNSGTIVTNASNACLSTIAGVAGEGTLGTEGGANGCAQVVAVTDDGGAVADQGLAWIITEDNIAYAVVQGGATATNAMTKQQIAAQATDILAANNSSAVILVDVNGLAKGPNTFETQGLDGALTPNEPMDTITGDRYKIYIGSDGATAGPREFTATGRMAADLK
ncbi:MAG: prepilin-type N-terminal cleavage/methylation domain-containing protein [Candidatus Gastranaerophilales bacterium]|nr:prepilin-type N-terminal cleavage/methylation domain-containing protein [Candidatus Gastranaerophilales bacterium]